MAVFWPLQAVTTLVITVLQCHIPLTFVAQFSLLAHPSLTPAAQSVHIEKSEIYDATFSSSTVRQDSCDVF